MIKVCRHCGTSFETNNERRLYCRAQCRRQYQNARRIDERAEQALLREAWNDKQLMDPWARNDLEDWGVGDIYDMAFTLDPMPVGVFDDAIGGPMAVQPPVWKIKDKGWKKNLLSLV